MNPRLYRLLTLLGLLLSISSAPAIEPATPVEQPAAVAPPNVKTDLPASENPTPAKARTVNIAAVGDTMLGSSFPFVEELPPEDGARVLSRVSSLWANSDAVMVNLEGVLLDGAGTGKTCSRPEICFLFKMPERYVAHLKQAGVTVANLANNHVNDFGPTGRKSSVQVLDQAGLLPIGVAESPSRVSRTANGLRVGWIGFSPHANTLPMLDADRVKTDIAQLKKQADIVVVTVHAGAEGLQATRVTRAFEEYLNTPRGNIYEFAHLAVDAGADLVVGHGPHVLRGMEIYKGRLIAYSLGNFATYGRFNLRDINGLAGILKVELSEQGQFLSGQWLGTKQDKTSDSWKQGIGPEPDTASIALLRRLTQLDFPDTGVQIADDGQLSVPVARKTSQPVTPVPSKPTPPPAEPTPSPAGAVNAE
jgi:poly-gamma-glutamate capsule biosynthesis protein CapA/YwtB (metallophosphatase superfamily)